MILSSQLIHIFLPLGTPQYTLFYPTVVSPFHKVISPPFLFPCGFNIFSSSPAEYESYNTSCPVSSCKRPWFCYTGAPCSLLPGCFEVFSLLPIWGPTLFCEPHTSHPAFITLWSCFVHCLLTLGYPHYPPTRVATVSPTPLPRVITFLMMISPCYIFWNHSLPPAIRFHC